jgi:hypothetical protein
MNIETLQKAVQIEIYFAKAVQIEIYFAKAVR